ncbi:molybdate ABC transporter permease subunit [Cohaesibacter celericrescens]|uniref:Molybdenum transport system permease n=1 Tax=Cohaesibacter celericrescens TaxID=2067669 RepID=A0A2N5XL83_9HYPH|nr:molybdate ABC transporter permease subunit [Cohaesibacter celericrescens]PLW75291.1 molybdate ABC transporter permease subunit [Cohaesibacter celericrescens]
MIDWITPIETEALLISFKVSFTAVLISLPLAIATAFVLSKPDFFGKALLDGLVHLPLILPPVVMGYLLLISLGTRAPLGQWLQESFGIRFIFSWTGAALAAGIVTFPFQVRAIRLSIEAIDPGLINAAKTLGAGPFDRFTSIIMPLALPGIIAGAITAFAASLGEFGAIITFVSNIPGETRTLPLAIYSAIQTPGGENAAGRLVVLSILLAFSGLVLSDIANRHIKKRMNQ